MGSVQSKMGCGQNSGHESSSGGCPCIQGKIESGRLSFGWNMGKAQQRSSGNWGIRAPRCRHYGTRIISSRKRQVSSTSVVNEKASRLPNRRRQPSSIIWNMVGVLPGPCEPWGTLARNFFPRGAKNWPRVGASALVVQYNSPASRSRKR